LGEEVTERPRFSIIAVDYEHHVPRQGMARGIESLAKQTFKDFELIICHDGPKKTPYEEEVDFNALGLDPIIISTDTWKNNWGHSSRDLAMRQATGEYFIQFNIDNFFYEDAFEKLDARLKEIEAKVLVFQILHFKVNGGSQPFPGVPPILCNIDAMQLVAHRDIWEEVGYWYRDDFCSDGYIYQDICARFPWAELPEVIGENY